jgi:hypothetical protein
MRFTERRKILLFGQPIARELTDTLVEQLGGTFFDHRIRNLKRRLSHHALDERIKQLLARALLRRVLEPATRVRPKCFEIPFELRQRWQFIPLGKQPLLNVLHLDGVGYIAPAQILVLVIFSIMDRNRARLAGSCAKQCLVDFGANLALD